MENITGTKIDEIRVSFQLKNMPIKTPEITELEFSIIVDVRSVETPFKTLTSEDRI